MPCLIIAHEYGSNRSDVLGKLETLISSLNKQGYWIFLFDFRGHGQSSTPSALGYKEQEDLRAALTEVLKYKQIEPRVGVLGIGMGAIAAIQTCGDVDSVKFVILIQFTMTFLHSYHRKLPMSILLLNLRSPLYYSQLG